MAGLEHVEISPLAAPHPAWSGPVPVRADRNRFLALGFGAARSAAAKRFSHAKEAGFRYCAGADS